MPWHHLPRHVRWLSRVRFGVALCLLVGIVVGAYHGVFTEPVPLMIIASGILTYNLAAALLIRTGRVETPACNVRLCGALIIADMLALAALDYFCGGIENPIVVFYVLPVATAGLLLPRLFTYVVATVAVGSLAAIAFLQAAYPSMHHGLPFAFPGLHFERYTFIGLVLGIVGAATFLTAYATTTIRKWVMQAEARVTRSRDVLNAIISCMTEAVVFFSPDGDVLLENPAFRQWLCGDGPDAGMPLEIAQYVARFRASEAPLAPESFPVTVATEGEESAQRFLASASSVHDTHGRHLGCVIVAENVTEQWLLEQDLRARNREVTAMSETLRRNQHEMAQREKMVAIGTMAAGVAHEIGNPLTGLSAVIQLLKRRHPRPEQVEHLNTLGDQVDRIATIVRQLGEFARPAPTERTLVDLDALIEDTLGILRYSRHARRLAVESVPHGHLPRVLLNPQQFQQILLNLVLNAFDATEEKQAGTPVRIECDCLDGCVNVRVRDHGCGMTAEQIRMAFEPFYTTKPPNRGTGLGLAVSYRLVERHGGRIAIHSTPGEGTTVTVSFPAAEAAETAPHEASGPIGKVDRS